MAIQASSLLPRDPVAGMCNKKIAGSLLTVVFEEFTGGNAGFVLLIFLLNRSFINMSFSDMHGEKLLPAMLRFFLFSVER